jgi:hypothetical protein
VCIESVLAVALLVEVDEVVVPLEEVRVLSHLSLEHFIDTSRSQ